MISRKRLETGELNEQTVLTGLQKYRPTVVVLSYDGKRRNGWAKGTHCGKSSGQTSDDERMADGMNALRAEVLAWEQ